MFLCTHDFSIDGADSFLQKFYIELSPIPYSNESFRQSAGVV